MQCSIQSLVIAVLLCIGHADAWRIIAGILLKVACRAFGAKALGDERPGSLMAISFRIGTDY